MALVRNLRDDDPKTRANAAGALGNLARNDASLCALLLEHHAPAELLSLAKLALDASCYGGGTSGVGIGGGGGGAGSGGGAAAEAAEAAQLAPARVALFSLGNLATHAECHATLRTLGLPEQLAVLRHADDGVLLKYSQRIEAKLAGAS